MNGFSRKKVGTLTLGEKLKKLRSERRISLSEVSRFTHIQMKYLEYIETGKYDKLPADVYVKGFLKSYGDFLGIDSNVLIKIFKKEKGISRNIKKKKKGVQKIFKPVNIRFFSVTPKRLLVFFGVVSIVIVLSLLYSEVVSFTSNPKLIIFNLESEWETEELFIDLEGVTEKDAKVFINNQSVLVYDSGDFKEKIVLQPGVNNIEIKSINRFEKETKKNFKIFCKLKESNEQKAGNEKKEDIIRLEVKVEEEPVLIKVKSDESLVFDGKMFPGSIQKFETKNEFKITSEKGNLIWIKFGEEDFRKLSEEKELQKEFIFNKDNIKK